MRRFFVDLYTKGRNSQRRQKGGGAHKRQGAGSFSGRAVVSRCASISVMLFPLIYCSITCSTQAQFAMNLHICGMPGLAWSSSPDRQNALRANKLLHLHLLCMLVCAILKTIDGAAEKSKISFISTNAAGFCVKKPWNPQRIPAALCLTSCLCLRNIRHFLCFQIHLKKPHQVWTVRGRSVVLRKGSSR